MPSLFPGMDPYLEQDGMWNDFRLCFTVAASQQLNSQLRPGYFALIRPHEFFYSLPESKHSHGLQPDAVVNAVSVSSMSVRLPATDKVRESYIEVRKAKSHEAVAVVQLLSRNAKFADPPPHREQYLARRIETLWKPVHLIEIDLLRGGERLPANQAAGADYCALVSRWQQRPWADVWPMRLREPLPALPIPLAEDTPDAQLDLQAVLRQVCAGARYDDYIYDGNPDPPLSTDVAAWARQFIPRPVQSS